MNTLSKIGYSALGSAITVSQTFAAITFEGSNTVNAGLKGTDNTADVAVQKIISNFMMFLAFIAIAYGLYGGFLIVTAGGEEDKVKKGRTILMQIAIGLLVIFLANSVVQWVLTKLLSGA